MHRAAVPARARRGLLRPLPAMDLPFLILVLTLVGFGLVMLYSASSAVALYRRGDAWAYVRPQLLYAAMGIGAMWAASRVDYHIYHKLAWPLLALSLVLLVVVLFMPEYNGCKRWLVLPGLGTLQPSEIAKFAVVLVFAHIISLNHSRMESFAVGVVPFALVLGAVAVLMLLDQHRAGQVRLQQHQRRHHPQHQRKGKHAHGEAFHLVVVEGNDMAEHQHHREFGNFAGLQRAQPGQHQPALAAVVLRHKEHGHQQNEGESQQRPGQLMENMIIHPAGQPQAHQPQRRV